MGLTPLDIQNKEFKKSLRGYNEREVDEFLDQVCFEFEQLYRESAELKDKVENLKELLYDYKEMEDSLKNSIILAQKTGEEVIVSAKKEAEIIISEAEISARKIIEKCYEKANESQVKLEEIKQSSQIFKTRLKTLIESQLDILKDETFTS